MPEPTQVAVINRKHLSFIIKEVLGLDELDAQAFWFAADKLGLLRTPILGEIRGQSVNQCEHTHFYEPHGLVGVPVRRNPITASVWGLKTLRSNMKNRSVK